MREFSPLRFTNPSQVPGVTAEGQRLVSASNIHCSFNLMCLPCSRCCPAVARSPLVTVEGGVECCPYFLLCCFGLTLGGGGMIGFGVPGLHFLTTSASALSLPKSTGREPVSDQEAGGGPRERRHGQRQGTESEEGWESGRGTWPVRVGRS